MTGISNDNDQAECGLRTSLQPNLIGPQPEGPKVNQEQPSNATIAALSGPIVEDPDGPHDAAIGLLAQPLLGNPRSPPPLPQDQNMSPPMCNSPHQFSPFVSASLRCSGDRSPTKIPSVNYYTPHPEKTATQPPFRRSILRKLRNRPFPVQTSQPLKVVDQIVPSWYGRPAQRQTPSAFIAPSIGYSGESCTPRATELGSLQTNPLREIHNLQERDMMKTRAHFLKPSANRERHLQCPLSQFSTPLRRDINKHLTNLRGDEKTCHHCSYIPEDSSSLKEHLRSVHGVQWDEELSQDAEEAANTAPRVNVKGMTMIRRCKKCEFSSSNQQDYWRHKRIHMNPEKILLCPKCPFVSAHKHHMEYHIHTHTGCKPYKCDQCDYACINKAMLISHKKTHSNVYQYHCANCPYVSKFYHNLKIHLRNNRHNPGKVLKPDGTIDPDIAIDVYGNRRGPRRPITSEQTPECTSPLQQQAALPLVPLKFKNTNNLISTNAPKFPYNSVHSPINLQRNQIMLSVNHTITSQDPNQQTTIELQAQMKDLNITGESHFVYKTVKNPNGRYAIEETDPNKYENPLVAINEAPLDLSRHVPDKKETITSCNNNIDSEFILIKPFDINKRKWKRKRGTVLRYLQELGEFNTNIQHDQNLMYQRVQAEGQAIKKSLYRSGLQDLSLEESGREFSPKLTTNDITLNQPNELSNGGPTTTSSRTENNVAPSKNPLKITFTDSATVNAEPGNIHVSAERIDPFDANKGAYRCSLCGITFAVVDLYKMHMGCHGHKDPFTCNYCGLKTRDSIEFNMHLHCQAHK